MSVPELEPDPGIRKPIQVHLPLHQRLMRIRDNWYNRTGRSPSFEDIIERALDRAGMEEDQ
jgi:hypothetical protein